MNSSVYAGGVVIVNIENNSEITVKQIRKIFLGKLKRLPDGNAIIPIELTGDLNIRTLFNEKIIKKSNKKVKIYWAKKLFTGKGRPPKRYKTSKEVVDLIMKNKSMIGYIGEGDENNRVRAIKNF